jgi:hypothetical protein
MWPFITFQRTISFEHSVQWWCLRTGLHRKIKSKPQFPSLYPFSNPHIYSKPWLDQDTTRNKTDAANINPGTLNLHNVEIIPEPDNTIYANNTPQATMQSTRPVNNIFSSLHVSLEPNPTYNKQIPQHLISGFQILPIHNPSICEILSYADVFIQSLLRLPCNHITNVDYLFRLAVFGGLHQIGCFCRL